MSKGDQDLRDLFSGNCEDECYKKAKQAILKRYENGGKIWGCSEEYMAPVFAKLSANDNRICDYWKLIYERLDHDVYEDKEKNFLSIYFDNDIEILWKKMERKSYLRDLSEEARIERYDKLDRDYLLKDKFDCFVEPVKETVIIQSTLGFYANCVT